MNLLSGVHLGEFAPPLIASAAYLCGYCRRARMLARRGRPVKTWRIVSFSSGALLLTVVQIGPLDTLADQVLIAHMNQPPARPLSTRSTRAATPRAA